MSPFSSDLFMANFEEKLKENGLLPEKWWRYVDDIFSIIKKDSLTIILDANNTLHKHIKCTCKRENESKLQIIPAVVIRTFSSDIPFKFKIYRKPTNT